MLCVCVCVYAEFVYVRSLWRCAHGLPLAAAAADQHRIRTVPRARTRTHVSHCYRSRESRARKFRGFHWLRCWSCTLHVSPVRRFSVAAAAIGAPLWSLSGTGDQFCRPRRIALMTSTHLMPETNRQTSACNPKPHLACFCSGPGKPN